MTRHAPFVRMDSTWGCFSGLRGAFNRETRPVSACYPVRVPDDGFSDEDFFRATAAREARFARDVYEERLPPAEFDRLAAQTIAELDGPEGDEIQQQIAWFRRKQPAAIDRLAYVRRKMAELSLVRS